MLTLIIIFAAFEFIINSTLTILNYKSMGSKIPDELFGIYDDATYAKQQRYSSTITKLSLFKESIGFGLIIILLGGWLGWLDSICHSFTDSSLLQTIIFVAIGIVVMQLVDIPMSYYSTFVVEARYGFNKSTKKTFWGDTIKSIILGVVLGCVLIGAIAWLYDELKQEFWIYALVVFVAFILIINTFYSQLIAPLFNKQKPLESGSLRNSIMEFAQKCNFPIDNVYVIDGSKHSTKANAYFTGLGKTKRVVLYDTIIEQLSQEEIVAVLAHEIGHYKHHDLWKSIAFAIVYFAINLYVFSFLADSETLPTALGGAGKSFILALVAFSLLFTPINLLSMPISNFFTRKAEYKADLFACENGEGDNLISGLKKLHANSLSNLTPHLLYVWFNYSHPTLLQRIVAIKCYLNK